MPNASDDLSIHEFLTIVHLAGLDVSSTREPLVLDELRAQLANARLIDSVLPGAAPTATLPYDPTFPTVRVNEEAGQ